MANVTITVPDALVPRLVAATRATFPEHEALTDAQAFKAVTAAYWRGILSAYEQGVAIGAAAKTAQGKAAADSVGIG